MKFLTPLIIIVCALGIFFWFVNPAFSNIQQLQAEAAETQANLTTAQAAVAKSNDLVSRYNSFTSDELNRIATAVPDTTDPLRVIIELNSLASKYGTTIRNIQIVKPTAKQPSSSLQGEQSHVTTPITFVISLTYANFLSFLSDIEHDLRITDVSSINFTSKDSGIYDYTITVNVYSLK